jgi:hypothetical protein
MNIDQDQILFFEFVSSLSLDQLRKYFAMLGPEESEYVLQVVRNVGTHLNLAIADFHDPVEDLTLAESVLGSFTLSGKTK